MSNRLFIILGILGTCLALMFVTSSARAGADWQERQKEMFAQISVKPGDIVDKSNWEKVKDIVPEPVEDWVKRGEWILKIGEFKYDFDFTPEWYELSKKNAGKYGLGEKKEIIDLKTGKFPLFLRGEPFPNVDVKNDPDGPIKFMHNFTAMFQMNESFWTTEGAVYLIGAQGYERSFCGTNERLCYWQRPRGPIPNSNEYMLALITLTTRPYDLRGLSTLMTRYLDGRDDNVYTYVPTIRRVKRLSGANRSDPYLGGDATHDDGNGFDGQVESMKWTYIGEKVMLSPQWAKYLERPRIYKRNEQGVLESNIGGVKPFGWQKEGWSGVPWAFIDTAWAPREMWIFKVEPLDPYYQYARMDMYVDKLTKSIAYKVKYSRAGEYWKTLVQEIIMNQLSPDDPVYSFSAHSFNLYGSQITVDDKIHHATCTPADYGPSEIYSGKVQPRNFTPQALRTRTK